MTSFRSNRFDLIRLVLAAGVFVYHAVALAAFAPNGAWETALSHLAEISVQGFFIVSGALVAGSYERSRSLADYAGKRVRRLYPAYAVIVLIPAAISLALTGDLAGVTRYLAANLAFLNFVGPELPGLFANNRFTEVNGALWTLKIEVMFYAVLPLILFMLTKLRRAGWLLIIAIYVLGELWPAALSYAFSDDTAARLARQLPGQMAFFVMGIALWKSAPQLARHWRGLALCGSILLAASMTYPVLEPARALGLTGLIAAFAFAPGPRLNAARWGDISYGVYITHFPILQFMIAAGLAQGLGPAGFLALAAALVFAASYALWHFVEKPALRPSSHYRTVAASPIPPKE